MLSVQLLEQAETIVANGRMAGHKKYIDHDREAYAQRRLVIYMA